MCSCTLIYCIHLDVESSADDQSSISIIRQKAINSIKVPKPDLRTMSKKRKCDTDHELQTSLDKLTETAMKAIEKIDGNDSVQNSLTLSAKDPYAEMIASALTEIPKDKKFRCISAIMQVLDIYAKGKEVMVVEKDL